MPSFGDLATQASDGGPGFIELFESIFGAYSIEKHILAAIFSIVFFLVNVVVVGLFRGASKQQIFHAMKDVLWGFGCIVSFLFAPVALFFFGRAILGLFSKEG